MKVFISWSGELSKKVALIFRDWLPTVIQSIDPFVSSEDIEKGSRWNTDIAQELKDSTFGLICVTKDNLNAPWLNFEAGALSKSIENSYVAPLLFDIKPSDLKGSPIAQFQATSFSIEDMKRLVETLNDASGNSLSSTRLNKAFELCYPDLENSLSKLRELKISQETNEADAAPQLFDPNILEELLEMTRNTQRLLGNTDTKLYQNIDQVQKKIDEMSSQIEKQYVFNTRQPQKRSKNMLIDEYLFMSRNTEDNEAIFPYNILVSLSFFKEDFPWLYDAGNELVKLIVSKSDVSSIYECLNRFRRIGEFTFSHPIIREMGITRKEYVYIREMTNIIFIEVDKYLDGSKNKDE